MAGYVCLGAGIPKPIVLAAWTFDNFVNAAPLLVECQTPYTVVVLPPTSQMSPSYPGTALNWAEVPAGGKPLAFVEVKVAPPSVLT